MIGRLLAIAAACLIGMIGHSLCFAANPNPDAQRRQFKIAYQAAQNQPVFRWRALAQGLENHSLYHYLEYAELTRDFKRSKTEAVRSFLARYPDTLLAENLRALLLKRFANAGQWRDFLDAWQPMAGKEWECLHVVAKLNEPKDLAGMQPDLQTTWLSPEPLPAACNPIGQWLKQQGLMTPELVWRRIALLAKTGNAATIKDLGALLPGAQKTEALIWHATLAAPAQKLGNAGQWPDTARYRALFGAALARLARQDPNLAGNYWQRFGARFRWAADENQQAVAPIALWKAINFEPDAARWMSRIDWRENTDEALAEWSVREALSRKDYAQALLATEHLSVAQQLDPRWRYWRARLLALTGQNEASEAAYAPLAREANYFGFLAANRLGRDYALCPKTFVAKGKAQDSVLQAPDLIKAFELYDLGLIYHARKEWAFAMKKLSPEGRAIAAQRAIEKGWIDRGPLTLLGADETAFYAQRFPYRHLKAIRAHAKKHALPLSWVLGLIRSESAWLSDARSIADARGLMQLLPTTAGPLAKKERIPYRSAQDLFNPTTNLALGTHHLADMLERYQGRIWLATAAYNAGHGSVSRWLKQRPDLPPDVWVETIPFRETREYVSRVLTFGVIYDWRLRGKAQSLAQYVGLSPPSSASYALTCPAAAGASRAISTAK